MLTLTALLGKYICLGMTSDEMISKKDSSFWLQCYNLRLENICKKLRIMGVNKNNYSIFAINSSTSGASTMADLGALILTEETMKGGNEVNEVITSNNQ